MEKLEDLTTEELSHYNSLFFDNWTKEDILEIYKNSKVRL